MSHKPLLGFFAETRDAAYGSILSDIAQMELRVLLDYPGEWIQPPNVGLRGAVAVIAGVRVVRREMARRPLAAGARCT